MSSLENSPADDLDDIAFIEEAAGSDDPPTPIKGVRRLLWWIIPANLGIFMIWGAFLGILLPAQVAGLDPANKVANLAIVSTVGVVLRAVRAADRRAALGPHPVALRTSRALDHHRLPRRRTLARRPRVRELASSASLIAATLVQTATTSRRDR